MEIVAKEDCLNPLAGIVSHATYEKLSEHNLLHDKAVRDYHMRRTFRALRREGVSAQEAIAQIRETYAYLQFDTIRKIVYNVNGR